MRLITKAFLSVLLIFVFASICAPAQLQRLLQYKPTHQDMLQRYGSVALKDSLLKNTVYNNGVRARWLQNGTAFWYANVLNVDE